MIHDGQLCVIRRRTGNPVVTYEDMECVGLYVRFVSPNNKPVYYLVDPVELDPPKTLSNDAVDGTGNNGQPGRRYCVCGVASTDYMLSIFKRVCSESGRDDIESILRDSVVDGLRKQKESFNATIKAYEEKIKELRSAERKYSEIEDHIRRIDEQIKTAESGSHTFEYACGFHDGEPGRIYVWYIPEYLKGKVRVDSLCHVSTTRGTQIARITEIKKTRYMLDHKPVIDVIGSYI